MKGLIEYFNGTSFTDLKISLFVMHRTVRIIREGPGSGFGFTLSGDSPVFVKSVDRGKCLFKVFVSLVCIRR